ncbi:unnamed protein product, partial [Rotaria sordida]
QTNTIVAEFRNTQNARLENAAKIRIDNLEFRYTKFNDSYRNWIETLEKHRDKCCLLKLFSNRQIMILIILLRKSAYQESLRSRFLKKLFSYKNFNNENDEENLIIKCLMHYLRSLNIKNCDLSDDRVTHLYKTHQLEFGMNTDLCLQNLSEFLNKLFYNGQPLLEERIMKDENQQFLVTLNPMKKMPEKTSYEHDMDMKTCCILLNIFNDRLPASFQILWCSNATDEDIRLFFSRIRTFRYLIFAIMDIDKMHHRLRELVLNEQDLLTREKQPHGIVYYFSRELTISRHGLREFQIPNAYRDPNQTYRQLVKLLQQESSNRSDIQIIYGTAGVGKSHRINTQYKDDNLSCFSINDKLNLSLLISSFLVFDSKTITTNPLIYFNISIHAPFEELNRTLFLLFICNSLMDVDSGLIFSLPIIHRWKFIIEIPYSEISGLSPKENFHQILPLLSIISPSNLQQITCENYQLYIGPEEELVARFLKAYENRTIDRVAVTTADGVEHPVQFDPISDADECRYYIYNCINNYAPDLPRNKIYELSFTKFLYRRIRFFIGSYYCWNDNVNRLGSIAMKQMIDEAQSLTQISFENNHYPRVYLVYDPNFSLHILHADWNCVPYDLKQLFN